MAIKSSIVKVALQVNDLDRHYYGSHALTIAQHPSETEERVMVRALAFALNAHPALEFGKGLSSDDEPDLWQRDLTGTIEKWIEVGQPDEQRIRRACGRAMQVIVYTYSGRSAEVWWDKNRSALDRCKNLTVLDIPAAASQALGALAERSLSLQCMIQDGHVQLMDTQACIEITPVLRIHGNDGAT